MKPKPIGKICLECGSSMTDEQLEIEKRLRKNLISCCPDRKMVDVYTEPQRNWIPVSEKLPEDKQIVAFVVKSNINDYLDGLVLGGMYMSGVCGGFSVPGMTTNAHYWMPLPDAPTKNHELGEL